MLLGVGLWRLVYSGTKWQMAQVWWRTFYAPEATASGELVDGMLARQGWIIEWRGGIASEKEMQRKMREWESCRECVSEWQVKGGAVRWQGGMIVTANHVVSAGERLFFYNYELGWRELRVMARQEEDDIAWLQMKSKPGEKWSLAPVRKWAGEVEQGLAVSVWQDKGEIVREIKGKVLEPIKQVRLQAVSGEVQNEHIEVIAVMMESNLGMSGLPVWTSDDELVGIVVGVDIDDMAVTYVVRVTDDD